MEVVATRSHKQASAKKYAGVAKAVDEISAENANKSYKSLISKR
jgi:hypothetical protein